MTNLKITIAELIKRIDSAVEKSQRPPNSVKLLAVSKGQATALIREAYGCGLRDFGENYLQECQLKMEELADLAINWHFIGPLQSNKTRIVAEQFSWIHSVDRLKIAQRLSDQRPASLAPLNCCIQVNISAESSKSGVAPAEVATLARQITQLPGLRLRGLMAIPKANTDVAEQQRAFTALTTLMASLQDTLPDLDTLSMGMSRDMESAIAAGSTMVRIGTAVFGPRKAQPTSAEMR